MSCDEKCWGHLVSGTGILHLREHRATLGRSEANDLVVEECGNNKMISAQHAVILQIGYGALVIDTSLNGTYVNGKKIKRAIIKPNDTVRFGKSRICGKRMVPFNYIFSSSQERTHKRANIATGISSEAVALRESILCALCKDFLVFPSEMSPCSHLFCSECVEHFTLGEISSGCPVCGSAQTSFKFRVKYNFSSILDKFLKVVLNEREYAKYSDRLARRKADLVERQHLFNELKKKLERIQSSSQQLCDPFLLICQTWTAYEKLKFNRGIAKFPIGEGRELFCWMVRLTEHWVRFDANETDVSVALYNLNLLQGNASRGVDLNESKEALVRFIYGKRIT